MEKGIRHLETRAVGDPELQAVSAHRGAHTLGLARRKKHE